MKHLLTSGKSLLCFALIVLTIQLTAQNTFTDYKGKVIDKSSKKGLELVSLNIKDSNISTVTNSEGEFILKVPSNIKDPILVVGLIGYKRIELPLSNSNRDGMKIEMSSEVTQLSEVNISSYKDAKNLVKKVFANKLKNSQSETVLMTGFYRETIKRRNRDASLTEAVVELLKQPYSTGLSDAVKLNKARKVTNYRRLDTVAVKLQGGPFSTLYLDIMKYPEYIFSDKSIDSYNFNFDEPSTYNNRPVYVVNFSIKDGAPLLGFNGKLYIDTNSLALTSATYDMDLRDKKKAGSVLVKRKPNSVIAYPTKAKYRVDYKETNGKWHYSYSSLDLTFKVNKKRKLFNSVYTLSSEMAITDWVVSDKAKKFKYSERLRPTVILNDAVSGFSDPDFWGEYNLIEPEKSIESAINKIKRRLKRSSSSSAP